MENIIEKALQFNNIEHLKREDGNYITISHLVCGNWVEEKIFFIDYDTVAYIKYFGNTRTVCKIINYKECCDQILNTHENYLNLRGK